MSLHINQLEYLLVGYQKVLDNGACGANAKHVYVFQHGDEIMAVTNKAQGVGKLIHTLTKQTPDAPARYGDHELGFGRLEPADYSVQYTGTSKP